MKAFAAAVIILLAGTTYWSLSDHTLPSYPRTRFWIQAAECAQSTGRYLVVCEPVKGEIPVEDVSLADDRGHTLLLSVLARVFNIEPSIEVLRAINIGIGFFGFLALVALLTFHVGPKSAIFTALLGAYWIGGRAGPDVDAAYMGISALGAAALLLASHRRSLLSLVPIFFLLGFVALIREPVGLGLSLSLFGLAIVTMVQELFRTKEFDFKTTLRPALLILVAFTAIKAPALPTLIRDEVLGTKAVGTAAHGLSHNLFLGLGGFVENKWGIVWDDLYAANLMKKLHPTIEYCSDEYFKAIGKLYWSYVKEDPLEAIRVYAVKTGRTLSAAEGPAWPAVVSFILLGAIFFYARRISKPISRETLLLVLGPMLFGLSFIAQGILTHPAWTYIYPGPILLMICAAILSEPYLAKFRFRKSTSAFVSQSRRDHSGA